MNVDDQDVRIQALSPEKSFIVEAPAGSGKTELLTQRFLKLLSCVKTPEEILAITFTRKAANEMRMRILNKGYTGDPQKLKIMTIDAFCHELVSRMPLKSKQVYEFKITDTPQELYKKAVENMFLYQDENNHNLKKLLLHVDSDALRLINLCTDMLAHRDQWLPYLFGLEGLSQLENNLKKSRDYLVQQAKKLLPPEYHDINNLAELFLTKKSEWRKKAPLPESPELLAVLTDLFYAPEESYSESQKEIIQALAEILPILVAELQLVFKENNQIDFIEINLRALQALGTDDQPTDLALYWDCQLKHLLIDEFQDTSVMQLNLIEKLMSGWEAGDGRSIFLVGDPMQSIYRFRKAEVGIFLKIQEQGFKNIKPISLRLNTNFRTVDKLVDWHNDFFAKLFPEISNETLGAVTYKPSKAHKKAVNNQSIYYSPQKEFINIIKNNSNKHVAVLVRSRSHLKDLIKLLDQEKINYKAVDIAFLSDSQIIIDLLALTKAILDPQDRIAMLSVLRNPWINMSLKQLLEINNLNIHPVLNWAMENRRKLPLRILIEKTWLKLNGPDYLQHNYELEYVYAYFDLLEKYENINIIENKLAELSLVNNNQNNANLEIMTIHKSKGLEFDVVILPGLERSLRPDSSKLLLWSERLNYNGQSELLVAPIKHKSEAENKIYQYLKREEAKRAYYETQRVLYVAATRAKEELHILMPDDENSKIDKNSLLSQILGVNSI